MNKIKLDYEAPSCDLLMVRFEEGILTVSQDGFSTQNTEKMYYDDEEDL
jgi:hypothetical protein